MSAGGAFWVGIYALFVFLMLGAAVMLTIGLFGALWGVTGVAVAAAVWAFPTVVTWTWWVFRSEYEKQGK